MYDIISIGEAGIDTLVSVSEASVHCVINKEECQICFNYAAKITADSLNTKTAHNAMNNAVGSARLGLKAALYAHIGSDLNGQRVLKALKDEGIDRRYIQIEKNKATAGSVVINYHAERTILVHHVNYRYHLPALARTKWFYLTSMGPSFLPVYKAVAQRVKKTGELLASNPGPNQLKAGIKMLRPIIEQMTLLFLNKEEARMLTGIHEETDIKELLRGMVKQGAKVAILTDGPKGSYAFDGTHFYRCAIYPAPVVERTGCGDSFATAFTTAFGQGKGIKEALEWGTVNAAGVIQKIGPQDGLLTLNKLQALRRAKPSFRARSF